MLGFVINEDGKTQDILCHKSLCLIILITGAKIANLTKHLKDHKTFQEIGILFMNERNINQYLPYSSKHFFVVS